MSGFYVLWCSLLVFGDVLCWGTADFFWTHNYNFAGDVCFWLLWANSIVAMAKIANKKLKKSQLVWCAAGFSIVATGIIIALISHPPLSPASLEALAEAKAASRTAATAASNATEVVSNAAALVSTWRITEKQKADFVAFLKDAPKGNVGVWTFLNWPPPNGDIEKDIVDMLNAAGYTTTNSFGISMWSGPPPPGLLLMVNNATNQPPWAKAVQDAFKSIGLDSPGHIDRSVDVNDLRVMVGNKPKNH